MIIRKGTAEDISQLIQFLHDFAEYYRKNNIISPELAPFEVYKNKDDYFARVVESYFDKQKHIFVAEVNGRLIGYIFGYAKERPGRLLNKKGIVEDWFVADNYRNTGIGKKLLAFLIKEFKNENCNVLSICAFASHKETISKYRQMGFVDMDLTLVKKI